MDRYPDVVGEITIEDTFCVKSLRQRMGMVRCMRTTSTLSIPDGDIEETGLVFHHNILSKVKRHKIPDALILNLDQTPSKYINVPQTTLAKKSSKSVMMQLIYGGKATQSLPKFKFPSSFSLGVNPTHYSSKNEACKMIEEIIAAYVKNVWERDKFPLDQKALLIMVIPSFRHKYKYKI